MKQCGAAAAASIWGCWARLAGAHAGCLVRCGRRGGGPVNQLALGVVLPPASASYGIRQQQWGEGCRRREGTWQVPAGGMPAPCSGALEMLQQTRPQCCRLPWGGNALRAWASAAVAPACLKGIKSMPIMNGCSTSGTLQMGRKPARGRGGNARFEGIEEIEQPGSRGAAQRRVAAAPGVALQGPACQHRARRQYFDQPNQAGAHRTPSGVW